MSSSIITLIIGGLIFGSFLNVIIYRLPLITEKNNFRKNKFNLFYPRSHCRECKKTIRNFHNIPILSFLFLKGKCAYCKKPITIQYLLIEIITSLLTVQAGLYYGLNIELFLSLFFLYMLIAISVIDINHKIIPDSLSLTLLWTGIVISILFSSSAFSIFPIDPASSIFGAILGYLILWSIFHVYLVISNKEGFGYGDFKFLAALGAWLGWKLIPFILFLSSILGIMFGLWLMLNKKIKKDEPIPFAPFLAISGWISMIFDVKIIKIYSFLQL
ncbi:MAG: prepilin peptidase [Pseudomonadota bacterium]|nr:prepilin peptidase [Pseudomonadota bacterium]